MAMDSLDQQAFDLGWDYATFRLPVPEAANKLFTVRHDATKRGGTPETGSPWHGDRVMEYLEQRQREKSRKVVSRCGLQTLAHRTHEHADVLVTNGGKHAVYNTFLTLLNDGDEVLLPAPYWTTYPEPIRLAGGVPVVLPTDESTEFQVTVDQLEAALTPRTKVLTFVSPSNPTGSVYPRDQVEAIGRWAAERGLWVVTDEIYEHLTYGEHSFSSIATLVPELADQVVVLNGVAKTYAMTGWRVGWMIGPADVIKAASNLQSHSTSNVANVSQAAALAAVSGDLVAVAEMRTAFERRGRTMHHLLAGIPDVTVLEPQGAFYAFPNLSAYLGRSIRGRVASSTLDLCATLLEEAKVAVVPGEAFDAPGYARLSFALGDDDLGEGCTRIADLLAEAE